MKTSNKRTLLVLLLSIFLPAYLANPYPPVPTDDMGSFDTVSPTVNTSFTNLTDGSRVFARTSGPDDGSVVLLMHGFPSSSEQYKYMIPYLASHGYRVIAPDMPGFGFTEVPAGYVYSFANLATTIQNFLSAIGVNSFTAYIFDYGAPVSLRILLNNPDAFKAIITQDGNAYVEGLTSFWDPIKQLWAATPGSDEEAQLFDYVRNNILTYEGFKSQYLEGEPDPDSIDPASWNLDWALVQRPGNIDNAQLPLWKDYGNNVAMYPQFQQALRAKQPPLLAVWGKNDPAFGNAGAEAYKRDVPAAEVELWDGGHFLEVSHTVPLAERVLKFLHDYNL